MMEKTTAFVPLRIFDIYPRLQGHVQLFKKKGCYPVSISAELEVNVFEVLDFPGHSHALEKLNEPNDPKR